MDILASNYRSSTTAVVITVVAFIALFVLLYWITTCGTWIPNVYTLVWTLFSAAFYVAAIYTIFTPGPWWWKLIFVILLIMALYGNYVLIKRCKLLERFFN